MRLLMKLFTVAGTIALLNSSTAFAEQIPVKDVWAVYMPGTRDIGKLDIGEMQGKVRKHFGRTTRAIIASLTHDRIPAGPGFAVSGTGLEALTAAHNVLARGKEPPETVSGKINLIFYTLPIGVNVKLESIERDGKEVTIRYRFVARGVPSLYCRFALIPMGTLPDGKYGVDFKRLPTLTELGEPIDPRAFSEAKVTEMVNDTVCKPFTFEVK